MKYSQSGLDMSCQTISSLGAYAIASFESKKLANSALDMPSCRLANAYSVYNACNSDVGNDDLWVFCIKDMNRSSERRFDCFEVRVERRVSISGRLRRRLTKAWN